MRGSVDKAAKQVYGKVLNKTWKKYVVGAGGGATAWKVIEKLIALHFPTPEDKLVAWATLFGFISLLGALGRRGMTLSDVADEATDKASDVVDEATDGE